MVFKGRSTTNSKNMNKLLQFLDLNNFPKMQLFNSIGWEMVAYMHELVVNKTKDLVLIIIHFLISWVKACYGVLFYVLHL
jgi:hypothetical protein